MAHRMSFSVDHAIPLAHGGAPLDPTGFRPSHLSCNARDGQRIGEARKRADRAPTHTTGRW